VPGLEVLDMALSGGRGVTVGIFKTG
jgi:hypothetical protein